MLFSVLVCKTNAFLYVLYRFLVGVCYSQHMPARQADRQTSRQTDRQAGRQTDRQADRQTDRQAGRQADRQAGRQTDRQAGRQAGRWTSKQFEVAAPSSISKFQLQLQFAHRKFSLGFIGFYSRERVLQ